MAGQTARAGPPAGDYGIPTPPPTKAAVPGTNAVRRPQERQEDKPPSRFILRPIALIRLDSVGPDPRFSTMHASDFPMRWRSHHCGSGVPAALGDDQRLAHQSAASSFSQTPNEIGPTQFDSF